MPIINGVFISETARLRYLTRRHEDLESLRISLAYKAFTEFARIGHQIKGSASTFGFTNLAQIGINLENAAISENTEAAADALNQMEKFIQIEFPKIVPIAESNVP